MLRGAWQGRAHLPGAGRGDSMAEGPLAPRGDFRPTSSFACRHGGKRAGAGGNGDVGHVMSHPEPGIEGPAGGVSRHLQSARGIRPLRRRGATPAAAAAALEASAAPVAHPARRALAARAAPPLQLGWQPSTRAPFQGLGGGGPAPLWDIPSGCCCFRGFPPLPLRWCKVFRGAKGAVLGPN